MIYPRRSLASAAVHAVGALVAAVLIDRNDEQVRGTGQTEHEGGRRIDEGPYLMSLGLQESLQLSTKRTSRPLLWKLDMGTST